MLLWRKIIVKKFGDLLREIRKEKNMKIVTLAKLSGITVVQIHNLEINKCKPTAMTIAKLSKALDYEFDY